MDDDKTKMMFDLMEYDYLTDAQHDLVISFNEQFEKRGSLSDREFESLEDIFKRAAESVEWNQDCLEEALSDFKKKLEKNTKPMPLEFSKTVDKHFWELLNK